MVNAFSALRVGSDTVYFVRWVAASVSALYFFGGVQNELSEVDLNDLLADPYDFWTMVHGEFHI